MRVGRCVLAVCVVAVCCIDGAIAQSNTSIPLVQELSNNTSACSASSSANGNQPYCFASFNGFTTNSADVGAETAMPDSPAGHVSNLPIKELLYPGWSGKILCEYQPWFGASNHKSVGYSENSAATVAAQDSFMLAVGCSANLIDFYGALDPNQSFNLATANAVFADLSTRAGYPLKFGIMEDKGALTSTCPASSTNESGTVSCLQNALIAEMDYVNTHYANNPAYLTDGGNPLMFTFIPPSTWPVLTSSDWSTVWTAVKAHTDTYAAPFKYIFEFGGFTSAAYDNGRYAWMQPTKYSSTQQFWWGSPTSITPTYLDNFYSAAIAHPSQIAVGGLWKGFDDNNASWSGNRVIAEQCGQVLLDTANEIAKYFGGVNPQLPYVQIATWNDYEEGTEVETGIDNCYSVHASISGSQLSWSLAASDSYASLSTVHHFTVYYADAAGNLYTAATNIAASSSSIDLSSIVPPGTWTVYVEMVGQPLIINRMSNGVAFTNGAPKPQLSPASLSFSPQTVNTTSAAVNVTMTNAGSAALSISGISTAGPFSQTNSCPTSLAAGSSCGISVVFSPSTTGTLTGSLQVSDSAGSSPQSVTLSGTGVLPAVSFAPTALSFAKQPVGTTSSSQKVKVTNAGPGLLMISSIIISGDFTVNANSCSGTVAVGAACTIGVTFTPTAPGSRKGSLTLNSNAPGTNTVSLSGMGSDFHLTAAPSSQSVAAGSSVSYAISAPSSGDSFANTISLSCNGLPNGTSCSFSPSALSADTTATMTITTTGAHRAAAQDSHARAPLFYAMALQSGSFGFIGLVLGIREKRRKRWLVALCLLGLLLVAGLSVGCGGGATANPAPTLPGTPTGTYSFSVVGSSGPLNHSAALTLTVN